MATLVGRGRWRNMARARVVLQFVHCDETTELGHDELYVMVGCRHCDGSTSSRVVPGPDHGDAGEDRSCWDINDSGALRERWLRATLYDADVAVDSKAEVGIVFGEQDGGGVREAIGAAASLADAIGSAVAPVKVVAVVLDALSKVVPQNTDDVLGGVCLTLHNAGGSLIWTLRSDEQERAWRDDDAWEKNKNITAGLGQGFCLQLTGDGARYQAYISVDFR
ncbi:hypothetical protein LZC95_10370 [Pendulispora brunnea]|uniref:Uncharacterized protein n=1 Tax=Pendulispora brunnea TaxID=2905690 RepID=A0ABZ2KJU7_9BACT